MVHRRILLVLIATLISTVSIAHAESRSILNWRAPAAPLPKGPVDSLSVMSINLWHRDEPAQLLAMARRLRTDTVKVPDFIACQEVVFNRDSDLEDTAQVLASYMGYYSRGTKRTSDREGIAIVSRYPFAYYAEKRLEAQTSRLLAGFNRISIMGEFMVPGLGRVRVANVHLTNWGFEHHIRRKQLDETLDWIARREQAVPAAVTFLGGDFNAERHEDEMDPLATSRVGGRIRFCDFNSDEPSKGSPGNPKRRIDYVFVSAARHPVRLVQEKLLWKDGIRVGNKIVHPSDHLGVVHVYSFAHPDEPKAPILADSHVPQARRVARADE